MNSRRCLAGVLAALLAASAGVWAQSGAGVEPLAALRKGPLVVWYLSASAQPPESALQAVAALHNATPLNYSEKTTGNFGQNAASYGQDAGSYGQDADTRSISVPSIPADRDATTATPNGFGYKEKEASNEGQNAAGYGSNASNNGKPASAEGQNAGGYGQNAGGYGTEASSVGQNASSYGAGSASGNAPAEAQNANASAAQGPLSDAGAEQVRENLREAFPDLQMRFVAVAPNQLLARLTAVRGTADAPDVLLGRLPATWWNGMDSEFGLTMLRPAVFYPNGSIDNPESTEEVAILAHAPHMEAARAFALWMSEPGSGCPGCVLGGLAGNEGAAAAVAKSAVERLMSGEPLGSVADPEIATDSSRDVRRMLATMGSANTANDGVRVQVEHASLHGALAAVSLRVVVSSHGVFGVVHPLVVLRQAKDSQWRVLQLTLNLPQYEQANEERALMVSDPPTEKEQRSGVMGITQAAPMDDQTVAQMPQLVWDNHGGAGLQVVEWQHGEGDGWSEARLFLVQDTNARLRTQVMAGFAAVSGRYRWRVWSVGAHGELKLSPWRTFRLAM
ncbi:MAG: hypothetical protein WBY53_17680 [Acidobacteriaceae bacterium]